MNDLGTPLPPGVDFRRATRADNDAILKLIAERTMRAGLALKFDRSPDFFALLDAHSPQHETWILRAGQRLLGIGSIVIRPGYIDGAPEPVVYVGDLRLARGRDVAGLWRTLLRDRAEALRAELGIRYGYCCIIRGNRLARSSVLRARGDRLRFSHLCGYSSVAIFARKPWKGLARHGAAIRRATAADTEPVREFLDEHSRRRPFGVVFDQRTWRHRLQSWPGFGIENFYLALDATGAIAGCAAPWDAAAINRVVIESLPAALDLVRRGYNALAPLLRKPAIRTGPDAALPDILLTHVCVTDRDPAVFAALLDAAYRDVAAEGRHATFSLCLFDGDPFATALGRYWHSRVPMDLYWLAFDPAADPLPSGREQIPGFEIYLV